MMNEQQTSMTGTTFSPENIPLIHTCSLSKTFRTDEVETTALSSLNFEVNAGEFLAVMGPSGCGKSTLLNIIGMLDKPTAGEYFFDGTNVAPFNENQLNRIRRGKIGFVFQNFNLIEELNVFENVELPLVAARIKGSVRRKKVDEILERMQIGHRRNHYPQQLSGGQQQRVAVARAVITSPKLLLADEPTGNLDSANGEQVMQLLEQLNMEGTTIIMVTHSPSHAERAHRIIHLFDGHLLAERRDRL